MLAIETASPDASVALHDGLAVVASLTLSIGSRHAEALLPAIEHLLLQTDRQIDAVTHVCVDRGPGLFTGLRVGLSTARGLAFALDVPLVAVSSLEALAYAHARLDETIVCALDARRREVYVGAYQRSGSGLQELIQPFVATPDGAVEALRAAQKAGVLPAQVVLAGDGCLSSDGVLASVGVAVAGHRPHAAAVAALAVTQLAVDRAVNEPFELLYLRAPDAEITWDNRHGPAPR
jgi:tRNA threonylcarbamoyladenosine biosynthesis protein TsaB